MLRRMGIDIHHLLRRNLFDLVVNYLKGGQMLRVMHTLGV